MAIHQLASGWLWPRMQLTKPKKDVKLRRLRIVCKRALHHGQNACHRNDSVVPRWGRRMAEPDPREAGDAGKGRHDGGGPSALLRRPGSVSHVAVAEVPAPGGRCKQILPDAAVPRSAALAASKRLGL